MTKHNKKPSFLTDEEYEELIDSISYYLKKER